MQLANYSSKDYSPGAPFIKQVIWYFVGYPLLASRILLFSGLKVTILRLFGGQVGSGVVLKPGVRVKFPWKVSIGDHSWIGEGVWLDSIGRIEIGSNVCVSQGAYLCAGSHDWGKESFDLQVKPIRVEDKAWIAARAIVGPGVTVGEGAVLTLGSVAAGSLEAWAIYSGNPATKCGTRSVS